MKKITILLLIVCMCGCNSVNDKIVSSDSTQKEIKTSTEARKNNVDSQNEISEDQIDIDTIILKSIKILDTTFYSGKDVIEVSILSKFDSAKSITIPIDYLQLVNVKHFEIFDKYYQIKVTKSSKVIFNKIITKAYFQNKADSNLSKYGVLFFPNVEFTDDTLSLGFSYSIPLTDVGVYAPISFNIKNKEN